MIKLDDIGSNRVVGVIAAYVVIAFAVLEGLDVLVDALALPGVILTVAAVVAIGGLPVAAGVAWYTRRREAPSTPDEHTRAASPDPGDSAEAPARSRSWRVAAYGALAALVVLGAGWWYSGAGAEGDGELDAGLVAVMPFAVGGAHQDLAWLEQGALDLLAAKLAGDLGPRALDPRAVLSRLPAGGEATPDRAMAAARSLGAGLVLTGHVVGSPARFTISARLTDVGSGAERSRADVTTDVDSLAQATDQLVIKLLSLDAGEAEHRLAALTSTDPSAVRSYLSGQAAYRQGLYNAAVDAYAHALDIDSTFALAGMALISAAGMTLDPERRSQSARGMRLALAASENLSPLDRRYLELRSGAGDAPTWEQRRRAREQAVREMPDRPELWYLLGDTYLHWGTLIDVSDALERAERAFGRAVALDSLDYNSIQHLGWIAAARGDTATLGHYVRLQEERIEGRSDEALEYDRALATGDTAVFAGLEAQADTATDPDMLRGLLLGIHGTPWPIPLAAATRAAERLPAIATSDGARIDALWLTHDFVMNAGRPAEGARMLDRIERLGGDRQMVLRQRIRDALYWDAPPESGERAAAALETLVASLPESDARLSRCTLLQWHAHQGTERPELRMAIARAADDPDESDAATLHAELCLALSDAVLAARINPPAAAAPIQALDSILAMGPITALRDPANVALARLLGERGDYERAAQVADRVPFGPSPEDFWSSLRYETGRWAEQAGDFATAREAYADYLRLRMSPEPALAGQVEDVRRRLEALSGEMGG